MMLSALLYLLVAAYVGGTLAMMAILIRAAFDKTPHEESTEWL